ncbi:protein obstructor-E-like [Microplitis mediator]|uniref:protein obstructor-E-like n=1 Tax=Microplitis mediator TaxID=375433 RepID=UPI0025563872|nr:protein obstructor-E-like [Microplitis mediator]
MFGYLKEKKIVILTIFAICLNTGFSQFHRARFQDARQNSIDFNRPAFSSQSSPQSPAFAQQSSGLCPERTGRFPVPNQCDAYIECVDGVGEEKLCPEGLYFNPEARFNYPCGYPIDISCEGRPNLQPAQPTDDCPHQYGYFKIGKSSADCGQFMNCAGGVGYTFNCPEGLAFNAESYRCDWPDQVPDCDAEAFLKFTCPQQSADESNQFFAISEAIKFFRSPEDCQKYFICVNGKPRLQNCGEGNAFNELINACDAAENVTGCEPPFIPNEDEPSRFEPPSRFPNESRRSKTGPQAAQKGRVRLF